MFYQQTINISNLKLNYTTTYPTAMNLLNGNDLSQVMLQMLLAKIDKIQASMS